LLNDDNESDEEDRNDDADDHDGDEVKEEDAVQATHNTGIFPLQQVHTYKKIRDLKSDLGID